MTEPTPHSHGDDDRDASRKPAASDATAKPDASTSNEAAKGVDLGETTGSSALEQDAEQRARS
ncbi:MAG: hypothetical protein EOO22_01645 [Comamonadaceae bacterium]|nr:MAG: hypothetical protein EOO22_01645 [Comamonadaceae bacterium]